MRNATPGDYPPQPNTPQPNYAPSVPISVYRELAAELQATRVMLDSLNMQNQQLAIQNQHLRLEIERVVQSALQLRQVADNFQPVNRVVVPEVPYISVEVEAKPGSPSQFYPATGRREAEAAPKSNLRSAPPPRKPQPPKPVFSEFHGFSGELHTEQPVEPEEGQYRRSTSSRPKDLSGLWLGMVIFCIVISAFGAGFLIVRPFLSNSNTTPHNR